MADITKKVDQFIPVTQRFQTFNQTDAVEGDVILVKASLGKPAQRMTVSSSADGLNLRFNVYHTVYPPRKPANDLMYTSHLPNLTSGVQWKDASGAMVHVGSSETFELDGDGPITDIELVTASGVFEIFVS